MTMQTEPNLSQPVADREEMQERIEQFKSSHPDVAAALETFNISFAHYEDVLAQQNVVKTFVTTHTALP